MPSLAASASDSLQAEQTHRSVTFATETVNQTYSKLLMTPKWPLLCRQSGCLYISLPAVKTHVHSTGHSFRARPHQGPLEYSSDEAFPCRYQENAAERHLLFPEVSHLSSGMAILLRAFPSSWLRPWCMMADRIMLS